ncbi:MAG: hypothetical protein VW202_08165 [Halieaceae bacterium]
MSSRWSNFTKDELFMIGTGLAAAFDATEATMRSIQKSGEPESVKKLEALRLQNALDNTERLLDQVSKETLRRLNSSEEFGPFATGVFEMRKDGLH